MLIPIVITQTVSGCGRAGLIHGPGGRGNESPPRPRSGVRAGDDTRRRCVSARGYVHARVRGYVCDRGRVGDGCRRCAYARGRGCEYGREHAGVRARVFLP